MPWLRLVDRLVEWRTVRRALRGSRANIRAVRETRVLEVTHALDEARGAIGAGDPARALAIWTQLQAERPKELLRNPTAYEVLLDLGKFDEAETFTAEAYNRAGPTRSRLEARAVVAQRRNATSDAILRWQEVRRKFPEFPMGYVQCAVCLTAVGRSADAETLLAQAAKRFPEDVFAQVEFARLAADRADWPAAVQRWGAVRVRFDAAIGVSGTAQALREMGQLDEAEAVLLAALPAHPIDLGISIELALVAGRKGDTAQALLRWHEVRRKFPQCWLGYWEETNLLRAAGRMDDAEAALREAVDRLPLDPDPAREFAQFAAARLDWPEAMARWAAFRKAFPNRPEGYEHGAEALVAIGRTEEAAQLRATTPLI